MGKGRGTIPLTWQYKGGKFENQRLLTRGTASDVSRPGWNSGRPYPAAVAGRGRQQHSGRTVLLSGVSRPCLLPQVMKISLSSSASSCLKNTF